MTLPPRSPRLVRSLHRHTFPQNDRITDNLPRWRDDWRDHGLPMADHWHTPPFRNRLRRRWSRLLTYVRRWLAMGGE